MLLAVFAIAGLCGLIMLLAPSFFLAGEFKTYTGASWQEFSTANPRAMAFFLLDGRQMGWFMITLTAIGMTILLLRYRRHDRLAWYLCLLLSVAGVGGSLGFNLPTGDWFVIILASGLLVVAGIALAIGAGPILGKKAE
jgi:hypothetical protein